ncbi:uncharacterized protein LOC121390094 [Gigantopelta aegis]|uniref:uncharacterized protein LOC121390094 n=1 Tax=Gigantopelta aegis TaxID=1735272 RepID=UPI001B88A511|nr:uncharacterized protein LOC121390094 [Gigantopelta aegis]
MRLLISSAVFCVLFWSVSTTHLTVTSHWPGGYTANICITSSAPTDCGWRAEVEFQPPINLEIQDATIASSEILSSSAQFSLIHKEHTKTLSAGTDRCFGIVARVSGGQDLQQNDVTFTGRFVEICNPGHSSYFIPESWHGGFIGKLCMTTTTAVCGWQVTMTFSPAITKIKSLWDGNIQQPASGNTVVVDDAGYNRDIEAGGQVCFGFDTAINGVHVSKATMSITGVFSRAGICDPNAGHSSYSIPESWHGGFIGKLCMTTTTAVCGWQVTMTFSPAITRIKSLWDGNVHQPASGYTVVVDDAGYNRDIEAGGKVCFGFDTAINGVHVSKSSMSITGVFSKIGICDPNAGHSSYSIPESWHGGFLGELCMTTTTAVCGWQVTMTFSPAITKIKSLWDGNVHQPASGNTVVVDDAGYNRNIEAGGKVCFGFDTAINGVHVSKATMSITGVFSKIGSCDPTPGAGRYNYQDVLHKSILFYEAQRSGVLPQNNRIPWRGDSAVGDQSPNGRDLSGGWYDAGDFVKLNLPMAFSTTTLLWGLIRFKDGYVASGELANMYDSIRWPLDYFIKCWEDQNNVYWAQVGNATLDHDYWGRPEEMSMARPAFSVTTSSGGSDVSAETAAALAAGSIAFRTEDPSYSATLLSKAISLYDFAYNHRGTYTNSVPAADAYPSTAYNDELCWGAAWLYKATGDATYIQKAHEFAFTDSGEFSWDDKIRGCQVLLYEIAKERNDVTNENTFRTDIDNFLTSWMPGGSIQQTQCGLGWIGQWGALRYAANSALIALIAAEDGIKTTSFRTWATKQINFMLGDNLNHRSYVVGFGNNPPVRPHHSSSSCPDVPAPCGWNEFSSSSPNPQTLHGALVGGPALDESYQDVRSDYIQNEVACDYNAGFQSALAGLIHLEDSSQLPAVTPPSGC